ncbi:putative inorganic phosphate cotransporter [Papilio machaon]|uniref:putative inorganic phosphate cotransporter n=1 Tax=Papilio machaon TaxID=76193 RepID=UPI001E664595|nr:putative inorganic phosphate cotransporter [Papilio machaon]
MTEKDYKKVPVDENAVHQEAVLQYGYGYRHVQALLMVLSLGVGYMARAHLGVTIVAMTSTRARHTESVETIANSSLRFDNTTTLVKNASFNLTQDEGTTVKVYDWPKSTQEMVLGAFFLGYGTMMFPTGLVCQRWGGKLPLQVALLVNGIVSILTPWLTLWGDWRALAGCRVAQGLAQAGYYPALHSLLARWVPLSERGSLSSYVYTGSVLGTVVAFQVGGVLGASSWGWPATFWLAGALCLLVFVLLTIFGAASPADHKNISEDEKNFILGRIDDGVKRAKARMPWRAVLTSRHAWAAFAAHVGSGVAFVFFFTQVPTYMHAVLRVDIKSSGLLSSLPYIASFFSTVLGGYFSDFLTNRNILSIRNARIICNSIGSVVPAAATAAVPFTGSVPLAVGCFVLSLATQGLVHTGWMVNYMDLAPNFSGGLMAIGNTFTNVFTILMPLLVSALVTDVTNVYQWRILMFIIVGLIFFTNLFFVMFMSADTQQWNDNVEKKQDDPQNNSNETEVTKC